MSLNEELTTFQHLDSTTTQLLHFLQRQLVRKTKFFCLIFRHLRHVYIARYQAFRTKSFEIKHEINWSEMYNQLLFV